ncbi:hypothetical protein PInf_011310 [Phytophthora infestans]|nr:hypothetical protein PInf_011310 [Phytophthora infestans]
MRGSDAKTYYDLVEFPDLYRGHYRFWMTGHLDLRPDKAVSDTRRKLKWRLNLSRSAFISLNIAILGYYDPEDRLGSCDDMFWLGAQPTKRFKVILAYALSPDFMDDYDYRDLKLLLESRNSYDDLGNPSVKLDPYHSATFKRHDDPN